MKLHRKPAQNRPASMIVCLSMTLVATSTVLADLKPADETNTTSRATLRARCKEDVLLFDVEPNTLRKFVPSQFKLALSESGMGLLLVVVQHADSCKFDGDEVGQSDFIRMWIRVEGPALHKPVEGAAWSMSRLYWYSVFEGASNAEVRKRQTRAGMLTHPIERVALGLLDPAGESSASVLKDKNVKWKEAQPDKPVSVQNIGVDHVLYSKTEIKGFNTHKVRALATARRFMDDGFAEVDEGSQLAKYLNKGGRQAIRYHHFSTIDIELRFSEADDKKAGDAKNPRP